MSCIIPAARRRRACLLATSFLIPVIYQSVSTARAQETASAEELPAVEVNPPKPVDRNRVEPSPEWASRLGHATRTQTQQPAPAAQPAARPAPAATPAGPAAPNILAGASTTVITAEDIA